MAKLAEASDSAFPFRVGEPDPEVDATRATRKLVEARYLSFPFRVGVQVPETSGRADHVRELIEQVLFTDPSERIFRPEFGAGVRSLVFEPISSSLRQNAHKHLVVSLAETLVGEVDPKTLEVDVEAGEDQLMLIISYQLATIDRRDQHLIKLEKESVG